MKKIIAWLLVLALTAAISIGATLAYLTDTDEDVNVMTVGNVRIDQLEYERVDVNTKNEDASVQGFHDNKPLYPAVTDKTFDYTSGDAYVNWEQISKENYTSGIWNPDSINNELDKMVFVKNKGTYDAYVRTVFAFEAGNYQSLDAFKANMHLNLNETDWTWQWLEEPVTIGESTYFVATATYNKILEPGKLTEISLSQIALDSSATNADVEAFGDTYQILVKSQAIQADGFDDPSIALNEGFGPVITNIPWENDSPTKGIDMITAVNTYNGKSITSKVRSVVYGTNADYPEITAQHKGVLVDIEQDVPVNAYYVENDGLYQIYFLADDTIYFPKNATKMFNGMGNLTTMVVDNLSTERTTSLRGTFQGCNQLTALDVSGWDTSKVTDMAALFNGCSALNLTGYENWDTSSLENALYLFQNMLNTTRLDLSGWDVSKLTTAENMFYGCTNLTYVDTTGWKLSDLNSAAAMFYACKNLTQIKGIEDWGLGNATDLHHMFYQCQKLDGIDISDWNVSNVKDFRYLFAHAYSLSALDLSDWDVSSAQNMTHMFYNCPNLETLNAAGWNSGKVTNFSHMFASANQNTGDIKLKELNVTGWNTESVTTMNSMFYGCGHLTALDLSTWNVSNVQTMSHMFADCYQLRDLNLTGWETTSLESMDCMFNDCDSLITLDVSMLDTDHVKEFCQIFDGCDNLTQIIGLSDWNTSNGCTFEEMFQGCKKLTNLDLSSFDTGNARDNFNANAGTYDAFDSMFANMHSLEKLIMGENFDFNGNSDTNRPVTLPDPVAREGYTGLWRNVETNTVYPAADIPEGVAATYVPYYKYAATGAKMIDALNYLNADSGSTKITTQVSGVTFGLTENYADIVNAYTGFAADAEQDHPVCVYYVPNGTNYDVYVLSDDTIDAPVDCSNLCNGMSNLVSFDTSNLDFSKTTSMFRMLRDCGKLSEADVTDWDTSNVTNMRDLFRGCKSLTALDVSGWNTGKVETALAMFQDCALLTELDLNDWDVSNVTDASQMFNRCSSLKTLNVKNWNTKSLTNANTMFQSCVKLTALDLSGWDTSSAENMNSMFYSDYKLKELNVGGWNVSNVTNFRQMFTYCSALEYLHGIGNWQTGDQVKFENMFHSAIALKELDISGFKFHTANDKADALTNLRSLEKLTVGAYKLPQVPAPAAIEGSDGKWYNVQTGEGFAPKQLPVGPATYVAVLPPDKV